jgi:paraquat-inducible protein A
LKPNPVPKKTTLPLVARKTILILAALLFGMGAVLAAWKIIVHTEASTLAIEEILKTYNLKNEGAKTLEHFDKDHPFLGLFVTGPATKVFQLPSAGEADESLSSDVRHFLREVREESSVAAWWSWFLLCLSLFYVVTIIALERSFTTRAVLFSSTCVSVIFFVIGILAPAMVIWTAPSIPMESGKLEFVLQHEVRGIAAIIHELLTGGHWIIGGFLLLFSVITPLTKASLTFFVTACRSRELNYKIGEFIHTIGKWSMADVFVAAVLLALYALKFQEATKSIPCLGLYYFIGYCLLSMTTTELLVHSGAVDIKHDEKSKKRLGPWAVSGLFAGLLFFILGSSLFTYQQYTLNIKQKVTVSSTPGKLNNADLVLPVHK